MPQIKINIPPQVHEKLKEAARSECRSLTNFITYHIGELVDYNKSNWEIIDEEDT